MKKGFVMSFLFLVIGIGMMFFMITKVIPMAKQNSQNCTLKVEAVVIENEEYSYTDPDGYSDTYYRQKAEYIVNNTSYELTLRERATKPAEIGSTISIWVDPENPWVMTTTLEWKKVAVLAIGFSTVFLMIGAVGCFFSLKGNQRCVDKNN